MATPELPDLLASTRDTLVAFVANNAGGLLRYETAEDLAQGIHLHVLGIADRFEYRSDAEFTAWLKVVAKQWLAARVAHWSALKRDAGQMLRISTAPGSETGIRLDPAASQTGPVTFADRKEMILRAVKALATLGERDRDLVRSMAGGETIGEIAERLELGYDAAQRAHHRALDRFRKAYRVLGLS